MALRKIELGPERKFVIDSRARLLDVLCLIAIAAAPLVVLLLLVPLPLVLPILSVLSFVLAWGVALYALFTKASRETRDITVWDFAAAFTLIWIVAGMMSNPKNLLAWLDGLSTAPLI